jgi:hypothetical protein
MEVKVYRWVQTLRLISLSVRTNIHVFLRQMSQLVWRLCGETDTLKILILETVYYVTLILH